MATIVSASYMPDTPLLKNIVSIKVDLTTSVWENSPTQRKAARADTRDLESSEIEPISLVNIVVNGEVGIFMVDIVSWVYHDRQATPQARIVFAVVH